MIARNKIDAETICEVGCGAGEILRILQENMKSECVFWGYEISPQAFELCKSKANEKLHFKLLDITQESNVYFDLILLMDVLEHMEDYFNFLREIKQKSTYKIIQLPMDISVRSVLCGNLISYRSTYGHIHYFTKEVALQMFRDLGFEVIDYFYTADSVTLTEVEVQEIKRNPRKRLRKLLGRIKRGILYSPDKLLFAIHQDLFVRIMGRRRLLILVK